MAYRVEYSIDFSMYDKEECDKLVSELEKLVTERAIAVFETCDKRVQVS